MKFLVLLLFPFFVFSGPLVFVHLGENIPPCLLTTVQQARYFNPEEEIYLLLDPTAFALLQSSPSFLEQKIHLIEMEKIPRSSQHQLFDKVCPLDRAMAHGLWFYALKRFFVLFDFVHEHNLENVIHLESDTMLYLETEELVGYFKEREVKMAAPFQSLVGCIPCLLYIRDRESLSSFIDHALLELQTSSTAQPHLYLNDMQLLAGFYRTYGENALLPLPTLMPEYGRFFPPRKSSFYPDNRTPLSFLSLHASLFPGLLFDGADFGIYLHGNDRRYSPDSGPGLVHGRSLFNPSYFFFFWGKDNKGRAVPFLSFRGQTYQIGNLHFHSKKPEEYTSFLENRSTFFNGGKR